jgi:serine/threonine protein kinase
MARVWIARQTGKHGFEKLVAIKTILPKLASEPSFQTMFLDETRIAAHIEHANVAHVLDVGEQHGTTYLVMEYVDGEALSVVQRTVKKKGSRIPPGILLRVLADVCGGLHAAHELRTDEGQLLNVVHRDVSPQNILLSMRGVAKLIDFGIAKARDRVAGDTNTGTVKGKVRYMAPEQASGVAVDRRADIWSVGAILYHLISGRPPYEGESDVQTLLALTSGRPPPPFPPTVHSAITAIVKRALTHDREQRFETAAEMQQAIEDAMFEAKLTTSAAAMVSFLQEHVGDRAQKRKEAISLGVKAAADREKYAAMMQSNVAVTGSDTDAARRIGSMFPPVEPHSSVSKQTGQTSGTLGSAAIAISQFQSPHRRTLAVGGAAMGIVLALGGMVWAVRSPSGQPSNAPASAPAPNSISKADPSAVQPLAPDTAAVPPIPVATVPAGRLEPVAAAPKAALAVSAVPVATPVPPQAPVTPVTARPPIAHPPPPPARPPAHTSKPKVDDGF